MNNDNDRCTLNLPPKSGPASRRLARQWDWAVAMKVHLLRWLVGMLLLVNVALFLVGRYYLAPVSDPANAPKSPINSAAIEPVPDSPPPRLPPITPVP